MGREAYCHCQPENMNRTNRSGPGLGNMANNITADKHVRKELMDFMHDGLNNASVQKNNSSNHNTLCEQSKQSISINMF